MSDPKETTKPQVILTERVVGDGVRTLAFSKTTEPSTARESARRRGIIPRDRALTDIEMDIETGKRMTDDVKETTKRYEPACIALGNEPHREVDWCRDCEAMNNHAAKAVAKERERLRRGTEEQLRDSHARRSELAREEQPR